MKTLIAAWMLLAGIVQAQNTVQVTPDCVRDFSFTAAAAGLNFDNRNAGCTIWTITYNSAGFTAISLLVQSAPNLTTGVPGAYVAFAGTVSSGVNPNTATTQAQTNFTGYFPWMRVNLTSITGSGLVSGKLYGWRQSPSGGSTIPTPLPVVGPDAPGGPSTSSPVQVGGITNAGNVSQLQVTLDGAVVPASSNIAQADAVSNTLRVRTASSSGAAQVYTPSLSYVFNGATWDRWRGNAAGGAFAQGAVATGGNFAASTANPNVIAGQTLTNTLVQPVRVTTSGTLATIEGVGGIGPTDNQAGNALATPISGVNAGIQGPLWTGDQYLFDGSTYDLKRAANLANLPVSTTLTGRNAIGVGLSEKSSRWTVISNPAAGSQATASIAAEASVRHVADCITFSAASTTAPALTALTVNLRDGATGAGTIIWTFQLAIAAATGQNTEPHSFCGLNLVGTTNTAMTLEFSAALANLIQSVSVSGYNVN